MAHRALKLTLLGSVIALAFLGAWGQAVDLRFGDFYIGFIHPLSALEHLLPMLALGLLAAQQGHAKARFMLLAFVLALALGALSALVWPALPGIGSLNLSSGLVLGVLLLAARSLPDALLIALGLLFGLSHGYANGAVLLDSDAALLLFILGMLIGVALLLYFTFSGANWLLRSGNVAVVTRVAGGWLVAIAILQIGIDSILLDRSRLVAAGDAQLTVTATEVSDAEVLGILEKLLQKIYLAFDAEREEVVYDRLAEAVAGELLSELYLQQRRSLMLQHAGGASIKVNAVELIDTQVLPRAGGRIYVRCPVDRRRLG
ncbi:MAG: hypothetical protein HC808_09290 [Candidatus Competibacteraceae bacterium]|nr:hypothetical protein [Candidatus Competibacteraceae bacterium]